MIKSVGKIIRECREKQGLTIEKLAEKAEVSDSYISRLERNNIANARIAKLADVANALNLDLADLFTDNKLDDPDTIELLKYLKKIPENERSEISKSILKILKYNK
ncbi:helix-turn-helix domain-containing protein [Ligilactobacillus sp. WILCCON 0076]|uniref:Helix-turn-helix domain-containing protein n=1 Tax=Ligilactobacillus ubinensis TaxID=2876789 RepID=A0A9X2FKU4_9LACO|nr:helix-turn-helix transcriptional regulator [Ligilactobacillus ubinensis]MCP0887542.1 helix-turn-helix domain-containing protein [Ligilactobacillus ubinensis]